MILRATLGAAVLAVSLATPAAADSATPQPGEPCPANLAGAMTIPPAARTPLVCDGGTRWDAVTDAYPVSDRWLSYGPAIELHGQGRTNPSMLSGVWTGTPTTAGDRCHASQVAVRLDAPALGAPRVDDGEPGRPLALQVAPTMATIELSGDCLWQRAADAAQPRHG
jgi:hypothetical protein